MNRRKLILVGIAVTVMLMAAGLVINNNHSKGKYDIFADHRGLFEAVKDEAGLYMSNLDNRSDIGNTFLYSNNGNAVDYQFHDGVDASLQDKVRQIIALSEDKLNFLRYSRQDGKDFIRFVFDWEGENGNTYHIVYCESQSMVERAYEEEPVKYVLDRLDEGWFGIEIK